MTSKLEQIRNDLNKYIEDQLAIDPANRGWEVFAFEDKLYEVIDELDQLYDLVRDKHDDVMCGDWEAVKLDIADLHLLMNKLIYSQKGLKR